MARVSDARERLLESATALINSRSYADVGVQELCDSAGVKKGSFYHFFRSKQALTLAALDQQWDCLRERLLEDALAGSRRPLDAVRRYVELHGDAQRTAKADSGHTPGCQFGNLAAELSTQNEAVRGKLEEIFDAQRALIEQTLSEAVAAGELEDCDTGDAALALQAYVQGLCVLAKVHNDPSLLTRLSGFATRLAGPQLPGSDHPLAGTARRSV